MVEEARRRVLQVRQRAVQARRNVRVLLEGGLQDLEDVPVRHLRYKHFVYQARPVRRGKAAKIMDLISSQVNDAYY